jgi:glucokinase
MGTYGEFARGAATGAKNIFGLFAGTGVGGGLILNGELFNGFNGHAGEIGHIIVNWRRGSSLEHVAGRKSMMRRAKELLEEAPKKVRKNWKGIDLDRVKSGQLAQFYSENDPIALSIITDASKAIGAGIATVINLLSPEVVVVGGGVAGALGDSFIEHIWETAKRLSLPGACNNVRCVAASLGDDAGVVGCAAYARAKLSSLT